MELNEDSEGGQAKPSPMPDSATAACGLMSRRKRRARDKAAGRPRPCGQECPHRALLVYPDDRGFFQLRVLLLEFAGNEAERNALWLREIRSSPFSLSGGVARGGEDILFLRHGRIRCMSVVTRKLVDLRFIADIGRATKILRKCRAGGK
jgi:hypothetical protein